MKYRKKPVVIEAFRWTGGPDQTEDPEWIVEAIKNGTVRFEDRGGFGTCMIIKTLEGEMTARSGEYIIQGVKGEIYPCKPDIFAVTYDAVDEDGEGVPLCKDCFDSMIRDAKLEDDKKIQHS